MKNWQEVFKLFLQGLYKAVSRFPFTVFCLAGATGIVWYTIYIEFNPTLYINKVAYALAVGAFIGMLAQFSIERFEKLAHKPIAVYALSLVLTAGYFLIILPAPELSAEITVRTFVAVFAMLCAILWVPSFKGETNFDKVALIHFKGFFTSILYSAVLSAGIAAILAAVDMLLFDINNDAYAYTMAFIWVMFAPLYYLSLLPKFHSREEYDFDAMQRAEYYPRFLEILVSYILVPLVGIYSLVLFAYFIKILLTMKWPVGQLGPMVLIYSAVGIILFILVSLLENRFALLYRKMFPKILIPIVIMQMISVGIRLNAYGITESRYYVALFGVFSIVIGLILSLKPLTKNGFIALLAAGFAIVSILPPVDAFTVSRVSQITRLEGILQGEGILADGKLTPKVNASENAKIETTNILNYLNRQSSLEYIEWLPEDFAIYDDMRETFGFAATYPNYTNEYRYFSAFLDTRVPINISDYDISLQFHSNRYEKDMTSQTVSFMLEEKTYELVVERLSQAEVKLSIQDATGSELISTGLYEFAERLSEVGEKHKSELSPDEMTLEVNRDGYKLKILFQSINMTFEPEPDAGVDYSGQVFFGVK
ncbi:hypothetical protein AT727_20830 [Desulfitobacterium hafniense]|uniref:DUF4153 domain-containing protein n=2 Tax=Desulfitobacterium hafniense TaxID=49338 RepID=Q24YZ8_DESHY|nr:hypothetical protein AT727_20830 [Desulfitobacterium hafniense]BAE82744.1 hypothetical protein DSY0955 [Desulfitobacterium hafniense Y51]